MKVQLVHEKELGSECECIMCIRERTDGLLEGGVIDENEYNAMLEDAEEQALSMVIDLADELAEKEEYKNRTYQSVLDELERKYHVFG